MLVPDLVLTMIAAPGRPAVFGRIRARHDLELVDRVHRRPRDLRRQLLDVGREAVVGDAVEQEVVLQAAVAMHVDATGATRRRAARLLGIAVALHTGNERQQVVPVADGERQFLDLRAPDHRPDHGVLGVDERRDPFNGHRFRHCANGQREIEARARPGLEGDGLRKSLESFGFDLDEIFARHQIDDEVRPIGGRRRGDDAVGCQAGHFDLRSTDREIRRIADDAGQRRTIDLRGRRGGIRQQHDGERDRITNPT